MEALPPTAQRILAAAQRLLAEGGFEALKLSAIAAEAGESKASIGYHFGNKSGLVTALVDSLDARLQPRPHRRDGRGARRRGARARAHRRRDAHRRATPRASSRSSTCSRTRSATPTSASGSRRSTTATARRCCAASTRPDRTRHAEMRPFAMLMIAIVDGLAIQHGLDPDGADVRAATELWERLAQPFLIGRREGD